MTIFSLFLTALLSTTQPLEVVDSWKVNGVNQERFDLSGISLITPALRKAYGLKGDFLLVNDKSPVILEGFLPEKKKEKAIRTQKWLDLSQSIQVEDWDLEGIDVRGTKIAVVNEGDGAVIFITPASPPQIRIQNWTPPARYKFNDRFGIEGFSFENDTLLLSKEMPPLAIFEMNENSKSPRKVYERLHSVGSQTDIRWRDDVFYILDRESRCIWKTKTPGKDEVCFQFESILRQPDFDYHVKDNAGVERPEWSTAEGLELEGEFFYIALDNNKLPLKSNPQETRPSILKLKVK